MKPILYLYSVLLLFSSCYYDKADLLYPSSTACNTSGTVSYLTDVVPIFQQKCNSCHTASSPGGGVVMGNYTADKAIAQNGKLYGSIAHLSGYSAMPQGAPKLTNCQIATIKKWIDAGSPNN
jgi:hypothetical protein